MICTVKPQDVTLGMFIQGFEGSWLAHPFWRSKFLLTDRDDLAKLRDSEVTGVLIDESKGLPCARHAAAAAPSTVPASRAMAVLDRHRPAVRTIGARPAANAAPSIDRARADADRLRATQTINQSKQVMKQVFDDVRMGKAIPQEAVKEIVDGISSSLMHNRAVLLGLLRLKSKDGYTFQHSIAVCALMMNFARDLGLDEKTVADLGVAGMMHDIGNTAISSQILDKATPLNATEIDVIRRHVDRGHAILSELDDISPMILEVCLQHHEKLDGTGYPMGLKDEAISQASRICAICDVYDALTTKRPYRAAYTPAAAIAEMRAWPGHLDQALLFRFMQSIAVYPAGLLVRLRSNLLGFTLKPGVNQPIKVRAFYSVSEHDLMPPVDILIGETLAGDQIIAEENPAVWGIGNFDAIRHQLVR